MALGNQRINEQNLVPLMLGSVDAWATVAYFIKGVMQKKKEMKDV